MNFEIVSPGGLGNQLIMLLHIYNSYEKVDHIYDPWFEPYRTYFNIDDRGVLCSHSFYKSNERSFEKVGWGDHNENTPFRSICDSRFDGFKLKKPFEKRVVDIVGMMGNALLVSIHVRHKDYKWEFGGKCFFSFDYYVNVAKQKIEDWKLSNYKLLFFSDDDQPRPSDGVLVKELTGGEAPIDFFLMAQCNYFIHTWSTFSLLAILFSKSLLKFKDSWLIQRA